MGEMLSQITILMVVYSTVYLRRKEKATKLRVTGLHEGEFTHDQWLPRTQGQQRENFSILWRHHDKSGAILAPPGY